MNFRRTTTTAILAVALMALYGCCSDAPRAPLSTMGSPGDITCYSGGKVFYTGRSTGKIDSEIGSDGWYFREQGSGSRIRVSGDCLIRN